MERVWLGVGIIEAIIQRTYGEKWKIYEMKSINWSRVHPSRCCRLRRVEDEEDSTRRRHHLRQGNPSFYFHRVGWLVSLVRSTRSLKATAASSFDTSRHVSPLDEGNRWLAHDQKLFQLFVSDAFRPWRIWRCFVSMNRSIDNRASSGARSIPLFIIDFSTSLREYTTDVYLAIRKKRMTYGTHR